MQLVGCSLVARPGPVEQAYLPLADLTVIVGPNDAGKSRLLASLARALMAEPEPGEGSALFSRLTGDEADAILDHLYAGFPRAEDPDYITEKDRRRDPRLRDYEGPVLLRASGREACLDAIQRLSGEAVWEELAEHLRASDLFCSQFLVGDTEREGLARLDWCVPPFGELDQSTRDAICELHGASASMRTAEFGALRALVHDEGQAARYLPEAPVPALRVGDPTAPLTPRAVVLPASLEDLRVELVMSIGRVVAHCAWADSLEAEYRISDQQGDLDEAQDALD